MFIMEERSTKDVVAAEEVAGGYVHEPDEGMCDWTRPTGVFDFASMYPNVIIAYGLDPTTVGRRGALRLAGFVQGRDFIAMPAKSLKDGRLELEPVTNNTLCVLVNFCGHEAVEPQPVDGGETDSGPGADARCLKKRSAGGEEDAPGRKVPKIGVADLAVATTPTYERPGAFARPGMCPEVARRGLEQRNEYKVQKKLAIEQGDTREAAQMEDLEMVSKATNNSLYGITIQPHCPVYNPDMVRTRVPPLASRLVWDARSC